MDPMVNVPVDGFGLDGLVADIPSPKRNARQLSVAANIRIQDGELATIPATTVAHDFTTRTPVFGQAFYMSDDSGGHIVCFDDNTIVYIDSTGAEVDVTPTPAPTVTDYYYACQVNDMFFLTNGTDLPWQLTQADAQTAQPFVTMLNWDPLYRARIFEPFKSYVVAAGITISGAEQRSLVKWSHPLSPGDQQLFWDHTDPTLLAGENQLAVSGRNITAVKALRDNMLIFFDQSMWRMANVGGEYVMAFSKVFTDDGAAGPFSMADYDGTMIVVGFHDIYATDGNTKQSLSDRRVTRLFYKNAVIDDQLKMAYYPERREMFILHKTNASYNEADTALIYNVDYGAFTMMRLPGPAGAGGAKQFYLGPKFGQSDITYDETLGLGWTYDNQGETTYNSIRTTDDDIVFYLLSGESNNLQAMDGQLATVHEPALVYAELDRIDMQELFKSTGDKVKYISRMFPRASGGGQLQLSVGVSMLPTGGVEWKGWTTHALATGWAVGARAAGRYLGLRMRMPAGETDMFTLQGLDMELMVPDAGRR